MGDPRKAPRQRTQSPLQRRRTLEKQFDSVRDSFFAGQITFDDAQRQLGVINRKLEQIPEGRPRQASPTGAVVGTAIGATVGLIGVGILGDVAAGI